MKLPTRLGLIGVTVLAVLVLAPLALAAYSPTLMISRAVDLGDQDVSTDITFSQTAADAPTARVQIFAPAGFTVDLSQTIGAQVGTLDGSVVSGAFGGATVPVAGTVTVADPNLPALQASAQECTGKLLHDAIWNLNVTAAGQSLPAPVPVYVDRLTTAPFSDFATASVQLCLPHPSVASFEIKLLSATLHMTRVFRQPASPGRYRWTALSTPYADDATVNGSGTIETQAVEIIPVRPTLGIKVLRKVRIVKKKRFTDFFYSYRARLTGTIRAGGDPAAGAAAEVFLDGGKAMEGTAKKNGSFTKTIKLKKTTKVKMTFTRAPEPLLGAACDPRLPFPGTAVLIPCGSITDGGFTATTTERTVVKPKPTHKRIKHKKPRKRKAKH